MTEQTHEWDGCLMCAVRALTEGRPKNWGLMPRGEEMEPGTSVTGVVLRQGNQPSHYESQVPFVDLWLGGIERVRVAGHGTVLREAILAAEIQVGDTVTVTFEGQGTWRLKAGERTYRKFSVEVERGHH